MSAGVVILLEGGPSDGEEMSVKAPLPMFVFVQVLPPVGPSPEVSTIKWKTGRYVFHAADSQIRYRWAGWEE